MTNRSRLHFKEDISVGILLKNKGREVILNTIIILGKFYVSTYSVFNTHMFIFLYLLLFFINICVSLFCTLFLLFIYLDNWLCIIVKCLCY